MNKHESNRRVAAVVLALAALVALPAIAGEAVSPSVATTRATPGGISWAPVASFDKLVLTVKGGGHIISKEFDGGQPFFTPVDPEGFQLPDGTYVWELTASTRSGAGKRAARGDERLDNGRSRKGKPRATGLVQSGSFTIANGSIVASVSPRPGRRAAAADGVDSDADNE